MQAFWIRILPSDGCKNTFLNFGEIQPACVVISGESAGAGSVMLHDIANSGTLRTSIFINVCEARVR